MSEKADQGQQVIDKKRAELLEAEQRHETWLALQLGLFHWTEFKRLTEEKEEEQQQLELEESAEKEEEEHVDDDGKQKVPLTGADAGEEELRRRKALWSLLRAIHCFHGRHPKLLALCYREGALYADKLATTGKTEEQRQQSTQIRNICARLLYTQK